MAGYTQSTRTRGPSKKKVKDAAVAIQSNDRDIGIEKIENGILVRISGQAKNGDYKTRKFYAANEDEAKKIVGDLL